MIVLSTGGIQVDPGNSGEGVAEQVGDHGLKITTGMDRISDHQKRSRNIAVLCPACSP